MWRENPESTSSEWYLEVITERKRCREGFGTQKGLYVSKEWKGLAKFIVVGELDIHLQVFNFYRIIE